MLIWQWISLLQRKQVSTSTEASLEVIATSMEEKSAEVAEASTTYMEVL